MLFVFLISLVSSLAQARTVTCQSDLKYLMRDWAKIQIKFDIGSTENQIHNSSVLIHWHTYKSANQGFMRRSVPATDTHGFKNYELNPPELQPLKCVYKMTLLKGFSRKTKSEGRLVVDCSGTLESQRRNLRLEDDEKLIRSYAFDLLCRSTH